MLSGVPLPMRPALLHNSAMTLDPVINAADLALLEKIVAAGRFETGPEMSTEIASIFRLSDAKLIRQVAGGANGYALWAVSEAGLDMAAVQAL